MGPGGWGFGKKLEKVAFFFDIFEQTKTTNEICQSDNNNICYLNSDCKSGNCPSPSILQFYDFIIFYWKFI